MDKIRVSIQQPDTPTSTIRVDGVVDTITSSELDRAISALLSQRKYKLILDLAGVDYISSAGWGVFISHLKEARENAGDLRLAGMIPNVREVFELLEFDTILRAYPNAQQACESYEQRVLPLEGGPRAADSESGRKVTPLEELTAIGVDAPQESPQETVAEERSTARETVATDTLGQTERLSALVAEDPFASVAELRDQINEESTGEKVGWWWTFTTLLNLGLFSKRARFRHARRANKLSGSSR